MLAVVMVVIEIVNIRVTFYCHYNHYYDYHNHYYNVPNTVWNL